MRGYCVAIIPMLLCFPASAHASDMSIGRGVVCDTLKQVERVAALQADGKETELALQTVKSEVRAGLGNLHRAISGVSA